MCFNMGFFTWPPKSLGSRFFKKTGPITFNLYRASFQISIVQSKKNYLSEPNVRFGWFTHQVQYCELSTINYLCSTWWFPRYVSKSLLETGPLMRIFDSEFLIIKVFWIYRISTVSQDQEVICIVTVCLICQIINW